jgi:hypothetical protein
MTSLKTNFLTEDDLATVRNAGVPIWDPEELWLRITDEDICLTVKGARYLTEVSRVHGVPLDLSKMGTYAELCEFRNITNVKMGVALRLEMAAEMAAGTIPIQSREMTNAFIHGSMEEFVAAAIRSNECADAGVNVVPVAFAKK